MNTNEKTQQNRNARLERISSQPANAARHTAPQHGTPPHIDPSAQRDGVRLNNLLVVVDEALLKQNHPERTSLIERAIWLARENGAQVTLLHICFDESLAKRWYRTEGQMAQERLDLVDTAATRLAELATDLKAHTGLEFAQDVHWGYPEAAAIIQKAARSKADMILKRSSQSNYLLGLLTNTDWELIRRSPCDIWFVTGGADAPKHVLAAIGSRDQESGFFDANDYDVCAFARHLTSADQLTLSVLHTFDPPDLPLPQGRTEVDPNAAMIMAQSRSELRTRIRAEHHQAIDALIEYFHLEPGSVEVSEGRPSDAITSTAERKSADAIVMGAASLSRLGRLMNPVSAEPVLANAGCDVIIVRDTIDPEALPEPSDRMLQGLPVIDVERAVIDPDVVFHHSPDRLMREDRLSRKMRLRLLQIWEADLRAEMEEADEGGLPAPARSDLIPAIHRARWKLESEGHLDLEQTAPAGPRSS